MIWPAGSGGGAAGGGVEVPGGRPDDADCCGAAPQGTLAGVSLNRGLARGLPSQKVTSPYVL